jgi:hypothetical protein
MHRDVTDTLIKAMEEADGATDCLVIMLNDKEEICWISSTDSLSIKFGMLETIKHYLIADLQKEA